MTLKPLYYLGFLWMTLILNSCSTQGAKDPKRKWALLIANQSYTTEPLQNPIGDAKKVAVALQKSGFTTFIYNDLSSRTDMERAVDYFFRQVDGDDTVWIYYAGHGVQENGKNYLLPTQAKINAQTLSDQALPAQAVMQKMSKRNGVNIMVLDTCRSPIRTPTHDLAEVGGGNVLIVFSTASGKESPEGQPGEGSPLAKYLVAGINQLPWLSLEDLFQEVGTQVRAEYSKQSKYQDSFVYVYGWTGKRFCLSRCLDNQNITITP